MKLFRTNHRLLMCCFCLVFGLLTLAPLPLWAWQDDEDRASSRPRHAGVQWRSGWTLRIFALDAETEFEDRRGRHDYVAESDASGLFAEYRFTPRTALEMGLMMTDGDDDHYRRDYRHDDRFHDEDDDYGALTLGVNFTIARGNRLHFYLGPVAGLVGFDDYNGYHDEYYEDDEHHFRDRYDDHADFALGLSLGLDFYFGPRKRWMFSAMVRGMGIPESDRHHGVTGLEFSGIGIGYKF